MLIVLILAVGSKGGFLAGLCSPRKQTPGTKRGCYRQPLSLVSRQHPKTPRTQVLSKAHTMRDAVRIVRVPRRRGSKGALAVKFSKNGASKGEKKNSSLGASRESFSLGVHNALQAHFSKNGPGVRQNWKNQQRNGTGLRLGFSPEAPRLKFRRKQRAFCSKWSKVDRLSEERFDIQKLLT